MAVAPFASLCVMPFAFSRIRVRPSRAAAAEARPRSPVADAAGEGPAHAQVEEASADLSMRHGAGFAVAVVGIMLSEQTLMNAGVLIVAAKAGGAALTSGLTGFVFNVMLIVRAPLQLFQADPDLDPPPPGRPGGAREGRGVPPRDPDHDPRDRRLRAARWRSGCC